jgi:hypothetical protein
LLKRVFTAPLLSSRRPIVLRVFFCVNVFSESLPSNGYTLLLVAYLLLAFLPSRFLAIGICVTLLPPQGCSSRVAYRCVTVPSFPRSLLVTFHLPSSCSAFFSRGVHFPTTTTAPPLRPLVPYAVLLLHGGSSLCGREPSACLERHCALEGTPPLMCFRDLRSLIIVTGTLLGDGPVFSP